VGLTEEQMFNLPVGHNVVFKLSLGELTVLDTSTVTAR
jgi:hypothetical protein